MGFYWIKGPDGRCFMEETTFLRRKYGAFFFHPPVAEVSHTHLTYNSCEVVPYHCSQMAKCMKPWSREIIIIELGGYHFYHSFLHTSRARQTIRPRAFYMSPLTSFHISHRKPPSHLNADSYSSSCPASSSSSSPPVGGISPPMPA